MGPIEIVKKQSKIKEFNPVQNLAVECGLLKGNNLVVSSPTASGKTIIAELAIINNWKKRKGKSIYIVPLRALAYEKFEDFKEKYTEFGLKIGVSTGDFDSASEYLADKDVVILTSEKLDSLIRHRAKWLSEISLVVTDETHLLTDSNRGPTLEIVLTILKENLSPQILALSATISNSDELAEWLNAKLVLSDYRPVPLKKGIFFDKKLIFEDETKEVECSDVISIVKKVVKKGKQVLIFLSTRRNAESLAEKLSLEFPLIEGDTAKKILNTFETPTKQCMKLANCLRHGIAFHHAGLIDKQRIKIEKDFRANKIKVICATTTLAAGLNLPAFLVIIRDVKRFSDGYSQYIPNLEVQQMCIPGDSKVLFEDGEEVEIEKVVKNKINKKVVTFDGKEYQSNKILKYYKREAEKLIIIKTNIGKELRLTKEHPVFIKNKGWVKANNIEIGDKISIYNYESIKHKKLPFFFEFLPADKVYTIGIGKLIEKAKNKLNITEKELAKRFGYNYKISYHYKNNLKAMPLWLTKKLCKILEYDKTKMSKIIKEVKTAYGAKIKIPKRIQPDFLWLAGIIATEGNLNKQTKNNSLFIKLRIFNTNIKIINKAKRILSSFGLKPKIYRYNDCYYLEICSTLLSRILNKHFGIPYNNKTTSVNVPSILYSADPKLIGSYLSGVFDGDGNYHNGRILFVSSSKKFAFGLQDLLLRLKILSKISADSTILKTTIRGKEVLFNKPKYYVTFYKHSYINQFGKYVKPVKYKIPNKKYSKYHNINKYFDKKEKLYFANVIEIKEVKKKIPVYNLEIEENNNYFVSSFLVHNCGRAGRPKYDKSGLALLIAKNETEATELVNRYLLGEIEPIVSKLSLEPVLRMHILSLIATEVVHSREKLFNFFKKTFFGYRFGTGIEIQIKIQEILEELEEYGFLNLKKFRATRIGKRVSELYLDPLSAHIILNSLEKASLKTKDIFYLQIISSCFEIYPKLRVKNNEAADIEDFIAKNKKYFLMEVPDPWEYEYELFLQSLKTAKLLYEWISEKTEEQLLEKYGITPGELYTKTTNAEWLLYAAEEFAKLNKNRKIAKELKKLQLRMKNGIKEELLDLIRLKGIGRIKARKLYNAGIKSVGDIKKNKIIAEKLIGKKTLEKIIGKILP